MSAILGEIVHHKIYIGYKNIYNPNVTLNFNNLELLCRDCHNKEHFAQNEFTDDGGLKEPNEDIMKLAGVYNGK